MSSSLVRNEGRGIGLDRVPEGASTEFFERVYYIPQAIQSETVRRVLPAFEKENVDRLEPFAESLKTKVLAAWNKKLYNKQISLAECRLRVEEYLVNALGKSNRLENLSRALLAKAVALVFSTETGAQESSPEAKKTFAVAEDFYRAYRSSAAVDESTYFPRIGLAAVYKTLGRGAEAGRYADEALALINGDDYYSLACLHFDQGRQG